MHTSCHYQDYIRSLSDCERLLQIVKLQNSPQADLEIYFTHDIIKPGVNNNEINTQSTFKHCISQLASLIETILTKLVGRSVYVLSICSLGCYFCWLLRVVVEVALANKIQVQI